MRSPENGLDGVDKLPAVLMELTGRGWSDADLGKVAVGNMLRVMRAVEQVAARLQAGASAGVTECGLGEVGTCAI